MEPVGCVTRDLAQSKAACEATGPIDSICEAAATPRATSLPLRDEITAVTHDQSMSLQSCMRRFTYRGQVWFQLACCEIDLVTATCAASTVVYHVHFHAAQSGRLYGNALANRAEASVQP